MDAVVGDPDTPSEPRYSFCQLLELVKADSPQLHPFWKIAFGQRELPHTRSCVLPGQPTSNVWPLRLIPTASVWASSEGHPGSGLQHAPPTWSFFLHCCHSAFAQSTTQWNSPQISISQSNLHGSKSKSKPQHHLSQPIFTVPAISINIIIFSIQRNNGYLGYQNIHCLSDARHPKTKQNLWHFPPKLCNLT